MQEFESISASSYDPSALATKLTAKAADGWSVVAIVPTGGDVTAFLSRDKGGATGSTMAADDTSTGSTPSVEDESPMVLPILADSENESTEEEPKADENEAVSEPSGWAIAPESTTTSSTPTLGTTAAAAGAGAGAGGATSAAESGAGAAGGPTPVTTAAAATPAAAPTPAHEPAQAPAVPAGWYADPAGRFELRYWDGSTWTEHVSRSGQQFTDPPVA